MNRWMVTGAVMLMTTGAASAQPGPGCPAGPDELIEQAAAEAAAHDNAGDDHAADEDVHEEANRLLGEGNAHYEADDFAGALSAYRSAYILTRHPQLLYSIAQAHRRAEDLACALAFYRSYLAQRAAAPNTGGNSYAEQAREHIEDIEASLAAEDAQARAALTTAEQDLAQALDALEAKHGVEGAAALRRRRAQIGYEDAIADPARRPEVQARLAALRADVDRADAQLAAAQRRAQERARTNERGLLRKRIGLLSLGLGAALTGIGAIELSNRGDGPRGWAFALAGAVGVTAGLASYASGVYIGSQADRVAVIPVVAPAGLGVAVSGRF
ncbi:hypothetical protein [Haliangium sp.]|uniref:hypothetical protein n=1 Tax=Haliangium sp. TaxID=2663208 RepID=UPI003D0FDE24